MTYPVFAATDRRLLVVVLEARVLTEDLGGGFRKFVEIQGKITFNVSEEQFGRSVG